MNIEYSKLDIGKLNTYHFGKGVRLTSVCSSGGYQSFGDYTYLRNCILTACKEAPITIGKYCAISDYTSIRTDGDHSSNYYANTYPLIHFQKEAVEDYKNMVIRKPIVIGNDVWVGHGAIILKGVKIGDGAVIGAGSVVTKDVAPYAIVGGVPAREIRKRFSNEKIKELLEIKWWDWSEEEIIANKNFFKEGEKKKHLHT